MACGTRAFTGTILGAPGLASETWARGGSLPLRWRLRLRRVDLRRVRGGLARRSLGWHSLGRKRLRWLRRWNGLRGSGSILNALVGLRGSYRRSRCRDDAGLRGPGCILNPHLVLLLLLLLLRLLDHLVVRRGGARRLRLLLLEQPLILRLLHWRLSRGRRRGRSGLERNHLARCTRARGLRSVPPVLVMVSRSGRAGSALRSAGARGGHRQRQTQDKLSRFGHTGPRS